MEASGTGGGGLKCDLAWHLFLLDDFIEFGVSLAPIQNKDSSEFISYRRFQRDHQAPVPFALISTSGNSIAQFYARTIVLFNSAAALIVLGHLLAFFMTLTTGVGRHSLG